LRHSVSRQGNTGCRNADNNRRTGFSDHVTAIAMHRIEFPILAHRNLLLTSNSGLRDPGGSGPRIEL
jgi:hypothetical protein